MFAYTTCSLAGGLTQRTINERGHGRKNVEKHCARESVKTLSVSEDSNASFEVCCMYILVMSLWRAFWEKPGFHDAKKFVLCIQKAVEKKPNTLEIKFLHKKCELVPELCESDWKN